jgi:hypothetical protein
MISQTGLPLHEKASFFKGAAHFQINSGSILDEFSRARQPGNLRSGASHHPAGSQIWRTRIAISVIKLPYLKK